MTDREFLQMRLAEGRHGGAGSFNLTAMRRLIGALRALFRRPAPAAGESAPSAAAEGDLRRTLQRRRRCHGRRPARPAPTRAHRAACSGTASTLPAVSA